MKRSVPVQIAGQRFVLRSDASDDVVQQLAHEVDRRIKEIQRAGKGHDTQQVAILVALQLAEELHGERQAGKALKKQVRDKGRALLQILERAAGV